jgi:hypothetical protein
MNNPRQTIWGTEGWGAGILWGLFQGQFVGQCVAFVKCAETYFPVVLGVLYLATICVSSVMVACELVWVYYHWFMYLRWLRADIMCQLFHTCYIMGFINE